MRRDVLYEEKSGWPWWVHSLVLLTLVAAVIPLWEFLNGNIGDAEGQMPLWSAALSFSLGVGLPAALYFLMGQLRTRVTSEKIEIRWGLAELIKKTISLADVTDAEAVTYSPLGDFGGWGIRMGGKKKRAWTISGNRALLLHLKDGTRFYLGSEKPERMLQWVVSATKRREG